MPNEGEAKLALGALGDASLGGRRLLIRRATERVDRRLTVIDADI
jgi:hypothetical protein